MEVLKQQLAAFQEQLSRMHKAERAKDEEYRRREIGVGRSIDR